MAHFYCEGCGMGHWTGQRFSRYLPAKIPWYPSGTDVATHLNRHIREQRMATEQLVAAAMSIVDQLRDGSEVDHALGHLENALHQLSAYRGEQAELPSTSQENPL